MVRSAWSGCGSEFRRPTGHMPRHRVLLAIIALLAGALLAAGCARPDQRDASGQGATTVTAAPTTTPAPPATIPEPSKPAPARLLVWPYATAVHVTHPVA